jgi:hypothetical protein
MYKIVRQTREEKLAMYMKLRKKELAEMLISANDAIDNLTKPLKLKTGEQKYCRCKITEITHIEGRMTCARCNLPIDNRKYF